MEKLINEAQTEEVILHGKCLVISYKLVCGFTIRGEGSCVDPSNFNMELGRKYAKEDAINQLWRLEGYRLQWDLFKSGELI